MSQVKQIRDLVSVVIDDMKDLEKFPPQLRHTMFLAQNLHLITAMEVAVRGFCISVLENKEADEASQIEKRYEIETVQLSVKEYFALYRKYLQELTLFVNNVPPKSEPIFARDLPNILEFLERQKSGHETGIFSCNFDYDPPIEKSPPLEKTFPPLPKTSPCPSPPPPPPTLPRKNDLPKNPTKNPTSTSTTTSSSEDEVADLVIIEKEK